MPSLRHGKNKLVSILKRDSLRAVSIFMDFSSWNFACFRMFFMQPSVSPGLCSGYSPVQRQAGAPIVASMLQAKVALDE